MKIFAFAFATLAVVTWNISVILKTKRDILLFQTLANLAYSIQYFLLFSIVAGTMNLISMIRSIIFYFYEKNKKKIPRYWFFLFSGIILIIGITFMKSIMDLIPIAITIAYTYSVFQKNMFKFRLIFLISGFLWIFYNLSVGAYVTIIGNFIEIVSSFLAMYKYDIKKVTTERT